MRILFITNYYPPSTEGGGYMQLCEEVADGLASRGHEIAVLTSTRGYGPEITHPYPVHHLLTINPDWQSGRSAARQFFVGRRRQEREAVSHLLRLVEQFSPQVIFIWHAIGLPRVLLQAAEQMAPTVYYMADYQAELPDEYMAYWQAEPVRRAVRLLKRPLAAAALAVLRREGKPIPLKYEHVICVSGYVRQRLTLQGLIPESSVVVHNGIDLSAFTPSRPARLFSASKSISCLVAGRIIPDKGIHTAIEAFALLDRQTNSHTLTILGDGPQDYVDKLQTRVQASGLQNVITFQSPVPRGEMPHVLEQYDVQLLPSEYAEPIARSMQEAMAMGLLVIGTTTGGSSELLIHQQTGLVFAAGSAQSLATQLRRVIGEPHLVEQLALSGQKTVRESFSIDQTIDKIEALLIDFCDKKDSHDQA